mmetsp:Transcript_3568/g.7202  ORF Transcript_3568/g.7202 Transcript_3568/m.7202 type:complete len:380 (+) Transcript_3568:555-1694(+)
MCMAVSAMVCSATTMTTSKEVQTRSVQTWMSATHRCVTAPHALHMIVTQMQSAKIRLGPSAVLALLGSLTMELSTGQTVRNVQRENTRTRSATLNALIAGHTARSAAQTSQTARSHYSGSSSTSPLQTLDCCQTWEPKAPIWMAQSPTLTLSSHLCVELDGAKPSTGQHTGRLMMPTLRSHRCLSSTHTKLAGSTTLPIETASRWHIGSKFTHTRTILKWPGCLNFQMVLAESISLPFTTLRQRKWSLVMEILAWVPPLALGSQALFSPRELGNTLHLFTTPRSTLCAILPGGMPVVTRWRTAMARTKSQSPTSGQKGKLQVTPSVREKHLMNDTVAHCRQVGRLMSMGGPGCAPLSYTTASMWYYGCCSEGRLNVTAT